MSAKYACMASHATTYPLQLMCRVLGVSRSGFYRAQGRGPSARATRDDELLVQIHFVHHVSQQRYGVPRVHRVLRHAGEVVGHNRVARLMREEQLIGKHHRRWKRAPVTLPTLAPHDAPNRLARQFAPSAAVNSRPR